MMMMVKHLWFNKVMIFHFLILKMMENLIFLTVTKPSIIKTHTTIQLNFLTLINLTNSYKILKYIYLIIIRNNHFNNNLSCKVLNIDKKNNKIKKYLIQLKLFVYKNRDSNGILQAVNPVLYKKVRNFW